MHTTELKPCPFCGSADIEIKNTHTPCFWVECNYCEGQASGDSFPGPVRNDRFHYRSNPRMDCESDYNELYPEYQQAFDSAVARWNTRVEGCEPTRGWGCR